MPDEVFSVAVFEPLANKEAEALATLRELFAVLSRKNYSRDLLYRDQHSSRYIGLRYWTSEESRRSAQEDPDVHQYWEKLGNLIRIETIYETYEEVSASTGLSSTHGA